MELLWAAGVDANLVIAGREGWKKLPDDQRRNIPAIMRRLQNHPEFGRRLFWADGIEDDALAGLYDAADALIVASEAEGFGLPLIEAAQHELPIIARDILVFREVAGAFAYYFSGNTGEALAAALRDWLALDRAGQAPRSAGMPWLSWAESARRLREIVLGETTSTVKASFCEQKEAKKLY
jgi:glycosyltransferase involved in cell wall biosynthesis